MIEGGGLGVFAPEDVGPISVQVPNGVVDVLCADETQAVEAAQKYLSYFQGDVADWTAPDQVLLRDVVPPDRRRVYDVHAAISGLADEGSVLELRPSFAPGLVTALARFEGRAVGVMANNPLHLAGAIDAANADKAARFLQLCEAFGLPRAVAVRHTRVHGGARGGGDRAGPPRVTDVRGGRVAHRALLLRGAAQGIRPGGPGHGGRVVPPPPLHGGLAHR